MTVRQEKFMIEVTIFLMINESNWAINKIIPSFHDSSLMLLK